MGEKSNTYLNKSLFILAKGSIIVFIGVFLSKILTYLYKVIIARNFGPESYGLFSLGTIILTIFATFASLGLSEGILRYASLYNNLKNLKKIKPLFTFSIKFSFISSIIFTIIMFSSAKFISITLFHNPMLIAYLQYFSLALPLILFSNIFLSIIKANQQILKYTFIINILQNALRLIGILLLVLIGLKSNAIIGAHIIGLIALIIGSYLGTRTYIKKIISQKELLSKERSGLINDFISYSWPIIFVGFIGSVLYWIDSLVIGSLIDTASVGIYSSAFTIVSLLGIAPELFMQLFLPMILKEYSHGRIKIIDQISKQVSKWIGLLNIPAFTLMIIFPESVLLFLFGPQYLGATDSLRILAIGGFFSSFISLPTNLLSMKGKSKSILVTLLIASILNLFLSIWFVSKYGMIGAAIATSLVWILTLITYVIQAYIFTKIFPVRRKLVKIFLLSIIPSVPLFYFYGYFSANIFNFLLGLIIYLVLYFSIIIFNKCLDRNDYYLIKNLLSVIKSKKFSK